MHSIASVAEVVGVFGVREPSRRVFRRVLREVFYALRDSGRRVSGVRVWCSNRRIKETLRVTGLREVKRVYGHSRRGSMVWLVYSKNRLWIGVEVARRIYSRHWVTSAGLNPMVAYCIVSRFIDVFWKGMVLEVFAGGATMALEACRLGAKYSVGVELDSSRAQLSLENAWRNGFSQCYDAIIADAYKLPFRDKCFDLVLGDPPRGWRFTRIDLEKLLGVLKKVSRRKIILVLGEAPPDGRIIGRLRVGGKKIFVVEF